MKPWTLSLDCASENQINISWFTLTEQNSKASCLKKASKSFWQNLSTAKTENTPSKQRSAVTKGSTSPRSKHVLNEISLKYNLMHFLWIPVSPVLQESHYSWSFCQFDIEYCPLLANVGKRNVSIILISCLTSLWKRSRTQINLACSTWEADTSTKQMNKTHS